jgi:hypothetical protein
VALEEFLAAARRDMRKPEKKAPDGDVLQKIREAALSYNMGDLDRAMEELDRYSYEAGGDLILWLRDHIGRSEFEEVAERLSLES